jgi:parvulin-like peptidyl-prolyl isomerase
LLVPEIEEAAFNLQPGEISEVITGTKANGSGTAYYLVQVIEKDPQRQLTSDLLYKSLEKQFKEWLMQQWEQAEIIRKIDL